MIFRKLRTFKAVWARLRLIAALLAKSALVKSVGRSSGTNKE